MSESSIPFNTGARSIPIPATPAYHRHRPEQTALYVIATEHYPPTGSAARGPPADSHQTLMLT